MEQLSTLNDIDPQGKRVLVRVDFNTPMENGKISDDTRIQAALPTIQELLKKGASKVVLMSHLGRPEGKTPSLTLQPIAERLSKLLGKPVLFLDDSIGPSVEKAIEESPQGSVILLENLRFYPAEEKPQKDPTFAEKLARLGDIYINDAFGTAHRAHSSTAIIAQYFPHRRGIGFLMMKEVEALGTHLSNPQRPFTAIIGGAKISTKIGVISTLLDKVDTLLIGGAMSFTFFKAMDISIGKSLVEMNMIDEALSIIKLAKEKKVTLLLPVDLIAVKSIEENAPSLTISMDSSSIPDDYEGVDIGPKTIALWTPYIQQSKTILWNGPVGVFEIAPFFKGTFEIAQLLASLQGKAFTVVGGGDSVSALEKLGVAEKISHVSTGGGASLEFLESGTLPGIEVLRDA